MVRWGSALRSDAIPGRTSLLVTSLAAPRMTKLVMGFMGAHYRRYRLPAGGTDRVVEGVRWR